MDERDNGRIFAAETVGTAVLILAGPGTAILASDAVGSTVGIALSFGLYLARKVDAGHAIFAVLGQIVGGIGGAAIVFGIASGQQHYDRGQFAANLWTYGDKYFGLGATIVVEVVFTALLVMVVLFTTTRDFPKALTGVVAGLTLTLIHLVTIPVDNTSVNPVRSLATAIFADQDTHALEQLWAFILFPLLGAVVGVIVFLMIDDSRLEDTLLAEVPGMVEARDAIAAGGGEVVHGVEHGLHLGDDEQEEPPSGTFPTGNDPHT